MSVRAVLLSLTHLADMLQGDAADGLAFTALAGCAALESIHLAMPMVYHRLKAADNCAVWATCMRLLRSAPRSLRTLRVDVECGLQLVKTRRSTAAEYFAMLDWALFNTVLDDVHLNAFILLIEKSVLQSLGGLISSSLIFSILSM